MPDIQYGDLQIQALSSIDDGIHFLKIEGGV
jgi:hypothetical protein